MIYEVFIAVSVQRAVVLVVTPCRLKDIYHHFFSYHEVRDVGILHIYGGNRASCFIQNICKFPQDFISRKVKVLKHCETVTDAQQNVPCSLLVDEWDSVVTLNVHPIHPTRKSPTVGI